MIRLRNNAAGCCRREVICDIGKINDWLSDSKLGKVKIISGRLSLETRYLGAVERALDGFSAYVFSVEERRAPGILSTALSAAPVTSNSLQLLFEALERFGETQT